MIDKGKEQKEQQTKEVKDYVLSVVDRLRNDPVRMKELSDKLFAELDRLEKERQPKCVSCHRPIQHGHFVDVNQVMCHDCWVARGNEEQPKPDLIESIVLTGKISHEDLQKLKLELQALRNENEELKIALSGVTGAQDEMIAGNSLLRLENEKLKGELSECNSFFAVIAEKKKELAEKGAEIVRLEKAIEEYREEIRAHKDEIVRLDKIIEELKRKG